MNRTRSTLLARLVGPRYRSVFKVWLVFVGSLAALIQLLIWARPFTDERLTRWIASVSAAALRLTGVDARSQDTFIVSSMGTMEIIRECTGVYPTAMFTAAVLAFPCTWRRKLLGVGLGVLGIQSLNVIRVVSLFYVRQWWPAMFDTAHLIVWQSLIVFFALLIWIVWAVELSGVGSRNAP